MNAQTLKSVSSQRTIGNAAASGFSRPLRKRVGRGQAAIEFAMISVLALVVMLIGIQYALIGQAAVAVSQGSEALARYAASNTGNSLGTYNGSVAGGALPAAAQQMLSQSLNTNSWNDLTVNITSKTGSGATSSNPPNQGDKLTINLSYVTTSKLALPNPFMAIPPIFPGITFPGTVGATDSQMYE
jgi:Flp pilus assembly protein TadG